MGDAFVGLLLIIRKCTVQTAKEINRMLTKYELCLFYGAGSVLNWQQAVCLIGRRQCA
jgi:hypothetical protein